MSAASKQRVWWPFLLTVVCAVTYLAPIPPALFPLHVERVSNIGAPGLIVFYQLAGITDMLPLGYAQQQLAACALLIILLLSWFTLALLPFWREYRIFGLSLRSTRWIFAIAGVLITLWSWFYLSTPRFHDI